MTALIHDLVAPRNPALHADGADTAQNVLNTEDYWSQMLGAPLSNTAEKPTGHTAIDLHEAMRCSTFEQRVAAYVAMLNLR